MTRRKPTKKRLAADALVETLLAHHPLTAAEAALAEALDRLFWSSWKLAAVWCRTMEAGRPGYRPGAAWWGARYGQGSHLSKGVMFRGHVAGVLCGGLHPYRGIRYDGCICPDSAASAATRTALADAEHAELTASRENGAAAVAACKEAAKRHHDARKRVRHYCDGLGARYLVIDLDAHDGETDVPERTRKLVEVLRSHFIEPVVFSSRGGAGVHVYSFFDEALPTRVLHSLGRRLALEAGVEDRCDVFPSPEHEQVGHLVAVPYCGARKPEWPGGKLLRSWDGTYSPVTDLMEAAAAIEWFAARPTPLQVLRALISNPLVEQNVGLVWPSYLWQQGEAAPRTVGRSLLTPSTRRGATNGLRPAATASTAPRPATRAPAGASSEVDLATWNSLLELRPRLCALVAEAPDLPKGERSGNIAKIVSQLGRLGLSVEQMLSCFTQFIENRRLLEQRDPYRYLKRIDDHQKQVARAGRSAAPPEHEHVSSTSTAPHSVATAEAEGLTDRERRRAWARAHGDPPWSHAMDAVLARAGGLREGSRWLVANAMRGADPQCRSSRTVEGWLRPTDRQFPPAATRRALLPRILAALAGPPEHDAAVPRSTVVDPTFGLPIGGGNVDSQPPARQGRRPNDSFATAEMLRACAERAGGLRKLAAALGEKHQTLSHYLSGRSKVPERVAEKLCERFPDDAALIVGQRTRDARRRRARERALRASRRVPE